MSQSQAIALEEQGWEALSAGGDAARAFYESVLDRTVVMLLPGGLALDDRAFIVDAMAGQPWSSYELDDLRSFQPTEDTAVVTYGVLARRGEDWRLTFHQQTPR